MELKPCPFCGGEAVIKNTKPDRPYWIVKCKQCGAQTRTVKVMMWSKNREQFDERIEATKRWAVEAWNRRADHV